MRAAARAWPVALGLAFRPGPAGRGRPAGSVRAANAGALAAIPERWDLAICLLAQSYDGITFESESTKLTSW